MNTTNFNGGSRGRSEAGQVMLFTVLALGLFLIGAMAFAVDLSYMWLNRQSAQTAADAACTAGAMDMLVGATNGSMPAGANFTNSLANTYDCQNASPTPSPCSYASLNGYSSSITRTAANSGNLGDNVFLDFPTAASVGLSSLSLAPASATPAALMRVRITNNLSTWFAAILGSTKQTTGATAICAVLQANSPIPILVLKPTGSGTLSMNGGGSVSSATCGTYPCGDIVIAGGPSKSIQVNSSDPNAVNFSGGPTIDLCAGGNNYCGSSMGVWGPEPSPGSSNFWTSSGTCTQQNTSQTPKLCSGTQNPPQWNAPAPPIADPLAGTPAPGVPTFATYVGTGGGGHPPYPGVAVAFPLYGCPDTAGCFRFSPGNYPNGIQVQGFTAIFDPGIYYIGGTASNSGQCGPGGSGSFCLNAGGCIRPSNQLGDGSGGVLIYFADSNSVYAGGAGTGCGATVAAFNTATGGQGLGVKCTAATQVPTNLPTTLSGSVLLAPCQTPTVLTLCNPNCSNNYGDPQGTGDPYGEQRGILFFQSHSVTGATPKWIGNGAVLLAGTMYFHDTTGYGDLLDIGGTSGSSTYVLGDTIVDQLKVGGSGQVVMDLNPSAANTTLKAALVQ